MHVSVHHVDFKCVSKLNCSISQYHDQGLHHMNVTSRILISSHRPRRERERERERERDYTYSSHTGLIKRPTYLNHH